MSYSWSNDPTKSAFHGIASRQAGERGKQPINVFRCSVHVTANGRISTSANETNDLAGESRAVRGGTFSATSTHIPHWKADATAFRSFGYDAAEGRRDIVQKDRWAYGLIGDQP